MKSLSIVLLGTQMAVGGAQKLLLEQALWFHSHGHKVTVLFFYDRDNLHEKWTKAYPFEIQNLEAFDKKAGEHSQSTKGSRRLAEVVAHIQAGKIRRHYHFHARQQFAWVANRQTGGDSRPCGERISARFAACPGGVKVCMRFSSIAG